MSLTTAIRFFLRLIAFKDRRYSKNHIYAENFREANGGKTSIGEGYVAEVFPSRADGEIWL